MRHDQLDLSQHRDLFVRQIPWARFLSKFTQILITLSAKTKIETANGIHQQKTFLNNSSSQDKCLFNYHQLVRKLLIVGRPAVKKAHEARNLRVYCNLIQRSKAAIECKVYAFLHRSIEWRTFRLVRIRESKV